MKVSTSEGVVFCHFVFVFVIVFVIVSRVTFAWNLSYFGVEKFNLWRSQLQRGLWFTTCKGSSHRLKLSYCFTHWKALCYSCKYWHKLMPEQKETWFNDILDISISTHSRNFTMRLFNMPGCFFWHMKVRQYTSVDHQGVDDGSESACL